MMALMPQVGQDALIERVIPLGTDRFFVNLDQ